MKTKNKKLLSFISIFLLFLLNFNLSYSFYDSSYDGQWLGLPLKGYNASTVGYNAGANDFTINSYQGLKGNFNNEIGIKTKVFTKGVQPSTYMVEAGYDINGDGKKNLLYGFGGKLYLNDLNSGLNLWETKVLSIGEIISVESILGVNMEKQIIIKYGSNPYYMGLIDGKTGELISSSEIYSDIFANTNLVNSSATNYVIRRDKDLNEIYIIFQNTTSYNFAMKLLIDSSGKPKLYPFFTDKGLHNGQTWNGANNSYMTLGKIGGKYYTVTNNDSRMKLLNISTANTGNLFVPDQTLDISARYEYNHGVSSTNKTFFYDFNNDGNDEFISRDVNKKYQTGGPYHDGFVIVGGLTNSGAIAPYWGYTTSSFDESSSSMGIRDVKVAKNYADLSKSNLFVKVIDSNNITNREAYSISGQDPSINPMTFPIGQNQNLKLDYVYDRSQGDISGIFNNGEKDLVITNTGSKFNFYSYAGSGTFLTGSTAIISGSFYGTKACNKDKYGYYNMPGYYCGIDSDNNGYNEFITADGTYFVFNEIREISGVLKVFVVKKIQYNGKETGTPFNRGLTSDYKNMWTVSYDSTGNKIRTFIGDIDNLTSTGGTDTFSMKRVDLDLTTAGGQTYNPKISKIGNKNYVLFDNKIYDFTNASPSSQPLLMNSNFPTSSYIYDIDKSLNNGNELISGGDIFSINTDLTKGDLKYSVSGSLLNAPDFNGDGVNDNLERRVNPSSINGRDPVDYRIVSSTGAEIVPWTTISGCGNYSWVDTKYYDYNGDGVKDIVTGTTWCYGGGIYSGVDLSRLGNLTGHRNISIFDRNNDGNYNSLVSRSESFSTYNIKRTDFSGTGLYTAWTTQTIPDKGYTIGDYDNSVLAVGKNINGKRDILFKGFNGKITGIDYDNGNIKFDKIYFGKKAYSNMSGTTIDSNLGYKAIFADGGVTTNAPGMVIADVDGNGTNEGIIGSAEGIIYFINIDTGNIIKTYDLGVSIGSMIAGDSDNNGILDLIVSTEDGYIYQLTNSDLQTPTWVKDGPNYGYDIDSQTDNKKVNLNYSAVSKATGYFVQLYNRTEQSPVFDWVDVGNKIKACVRSNEVVDINCISAGKAFSLNGKSIYEWRVQAYNNNVTSPNISSNGFSVLNLKMDKKVAKKEDLNFVDELTVSPNTLLTYKVTVNNDSLNVVGGAGYMNYDMIPAQSVTNCSGISDCRTKNLTISDYMPTTFTYMPNSTIWIIKKINFDGTEQIISGGSQVSDTYFKNQSKTNLVTNPGSTLIWEFPTSISIPPGAFLELQFDAIARSN